VIKLKMIVLNLKYMLIDTNVVRPILVGIMDK